MYIYIYIYIYTIQKDMLDEDPQCQLKKNVKRPYLTRVTRDSNFKTDKLVAFGAHFTPLPLSVLRFTGI